MEIWWWTSVPYSLLFFSWVLVFRPAIGFLAHVVLPLLYLFELALWSSIAWTVVSIARFAVVGRSAISTMKTKAMLVLALATCFVSMYYFNRPD
jgi:hypothetical protein